MEPYQLGRGTSHFYHVRRSIAGETVAVMRGTLEGRGLALIQQPSRALLKGELHELIASTEENIGPGSTVNSVTYICFVEIAVSGVLCTGDTVRVGKHVIGTIAGFDYTHMPNHMNIVIKSASMTSGEGLGVALGDPVTFQGAM